MRRGSGSGPRGRGDGALIPWLVIDASSLVRAMLAPSGAAGRLFDVTLGGRVRMLGSERTLAEVAQVLARPKFQARVPVEERRRFVRDLLRAVVLVEPGKRVSECRDANDDMILEVALAAGRAGREVVVVSDDWNLLALDPWRGVRVVKPEAALVLLDEIGRRSG